MSHQCFVIIFSRFSFTLPELLALPEVFNAHYAKTPFPLTRGYFKNVDIKIEEGCNQSVIKKVRKIVKRKLMTVQKKSIKKRDFATTKAGIRRNENKDRLYACTICKKKRYKYRRNKLRHEKYECVTGPQFRCEICDKRYSQKKTLTSHVAQKHPNWMQDIKQNDH